MALGDRDRYERMTEDIHEIRKNTSQPDDRPGCFEIIKGCGCNPIVLIIAIILLGLLVLFGEMIYMSL